MAKHRWQTRYLSAVMEYLAGKSHRAAKVWKVLKSLNSIRHEDFVGTRSTAFL